MTNMSPDKPALIQQMFSRIAGRYDLMNRLMTLGRDQAWRRLAARELHLPPGGLCLDLATGTGDLALAVCEAHPGARVVGVDYSLAMMRVAQRKVGPRQRIGFAAGDALSLPF